MSSFDNFDPNGSNGVPITDDQEIEEVKQFVREHPDKVKLPKFKLRDKKMTAEELSESFADSIRKNNFSAFNAGAYVPPHEGMQWKDYGIDMEKVKLRPKRKLQKGETNTVQIYNKLIDIILNAKKDIERVNSCMTLEGATKYANNHDLYMPTDVNGNSQKTDINNDGVDEIVLFNRKGQPVIINGYKIGQSDFPFRNEYLREYDTPEKREEIGGFKGFIQKKYGADAEFDEDGKRNVQYSTKNPPADWKVLKQAGYTLPAAPRKELTLHQRFTNAVAQIYNSCFEGDSPLLKYSWLKGVLPRMKIISIVVSRFVDGPLWSKLNEQAKAGIINASADNLDAFIEEFRVYKQEYKNDLKQFLTSNFTNIMNDIVQNAGNLIVEIFAQIGLNSEYIKTVVNDDEIKTMNQKEIAEFKVFKRNTKRVFDKTFDQFKPTIIKLIYGMQ